MGNEQLLDDQFPRLAGGRAQLELHAHIVRRHVERYGVGIRLGEPHPALRPRNAGCGSRQRQGMVEVVIPHWMRPYIDNVVYAPSQAKKGVVLVNLRETDGRSATLTLLDTDGKPLEFEVVNVLDEQLGRRADSLELKPYENVFVRIEP